MAANVKEIKAGDVRKLVPRRDPMSHKGMNGRVMIIGGSKEYYGAPILSALGALYGGADLVYLFVPECNFDVSRSMYPDFIVRSFGSGDYFDMKCVMPCLEFSRKCDVVLVGPGMGEEEATMDALVNLVKGLEVPTVLDASAIQVFQKIKEVPSQPIVITPHHNEFETLTGKDIKISGSLSGKVVLTRTLATDLKIDIVLKGPQDLLASHEGDVVLNSTGNPGMTVGGTGDVLSGLIAGLMAQGAAPFAACQIGAYVNGRAGDEMFKQKGYGFLASEMAHEIPFVIKGLMK